jgi:predicted nuclease of predicted toxin-antitoxin system
MKVLLDQGVPRTTAELLRLEGIDAIHTAEIGLARAEDPEIMDHARKDGRLIVTLDADFHAELALSGARAPSVIRIRIEGLRAEAMTELLKQVLVDIKDDLTAGAVASVEEFRVRVRNLPLGGTGTAGS